MSARLEEHVEGWMQGGPSEWDVMIDGMLQPKLVLDVGEHDYVLASDLSEGPHRVELFKRSEAQDGYTTFHGYDFGGGALLPPPLPAGRRIEIVGDSGPAGFGIEGVGFGPDCPGPDWSAHWQNFHKSMAARLAEMVNADLNATVYSGKGLVRNTYRPDPDTIPMMYERSNPIDPRTVFDFTTFVPDVIVLMIGGNDFSIGQPDDDGPTPHQEFVDASRTLVRTMRSHAPHAQIFLAISPSVSDDIPPGRQSRTNIKSTFNLVATERGVAGDKRVYAVEPPVAAESELTGCKRHGNPEYHERVAKQLAAVIATKTGW
ncbi:MAG: Acetylxylan esterase [Labilithrix sp.]|nr:Acetylxylan esterase [Labilithrix sp.]